MPGTRSVAGSPGEEEASTVSDGPVPATAPPKVIVMGSSAGGLPPLLRVLSALPEDLAAAILIAQHRSAAKGSLFEKTLQKTTSLRVSAMADGQPIEPSHVYVAPPDQSAVLTPHCTLELHESRRMRHGRSWTNPLFSSVASVYGPHAIAIVLRGCGSETCEGVRAIRAAGGIVVAQDEASAHYFSLPRQSLDTGAVTYVLPVGEISLVLRHLVGSTDDYARRSL